MTCASRLLLFYLHEREKKMNEFYLVLCIFHADRAATIITREDGCQFLRVDKDDFNRILRDVEANTVRLKEHGRDVLVLEKVSAHSSARHSHYK